MWSEFVTPQTIDSRIWPRMAAVAEDLWSIHAPDIKLPNGYMTSVPDSLMTTKIRFEIHDMYRRLGIISNQLEQLGLRFKSNYPVMLRNLANSDNILALRTFVNVVSPVELYKRPNSRPYTQYSPFTRVVDAARPDPETVRHFRFLVNGYLRNHEASADTLHRIESWLRLWEINNIPLQKTIDHSPILDEIAPLSKYLSQISDIGLKALSYLHSKQRADKEWINNSLKILKNAAKPRGQVAIRVVKPIKKLVLAAGTNSTNFKLSGKSTSK